MLRIRRVISPPERGLRQSGDFCAFGSVGSNRSGCAMHGGVQDTLVGMPACDAWLLRVISCSRAEWAVGPVDIAEGMNNCADNPCGYGEGGLPGQRVRQLLLDFNHSKITFSRLFPLYKRFLHSLTSYYLLK